jgi:hypothetical protein
MVRKRPNAFRISSKEVNGSFYIMITTGRLLSGKDFLSRGETSF